MSRKLQISILFFACIASSILTWAVTSRYDNDRFTELDVAENNRQVMLATRHKLYPVVYCKKDIPANIEITSDYLEFRKVPDHILPANACVSFSQIIGRKVSYPIKKGSALFLADFFLIDLSHPDAELKVRPTQSPTLP